MNFVTFVTPVTRLVSLVPLPLLQRFLQREWPPSWLQHWIPDCVSRNRLGTDVAIGLYGALSLSVWVCAMSCPQELGTLDALSPCKTWSGVRRFEWGTEKSQGTLTTS